MDGKVERTGTASADAFQQARAFPHVGLGLVLGIPAALLGTRSIASQLFDVKSYDPLIFGFATVVLALCAVAAAYLPARRAASIDPMLALRAD